MSMPSIGILLAVVAVFLVMSWLSRSGGSTDRLSTADAHSGDREREFRIKRAVRVSVALGSLCGVFLIALPSFFPTPSSLEWAFFGGAGMVWVLLVVLLSVGLARARIVVLADRVSGHWPAHRLDVAFTDIRSVALAPLGGVLIERLSGKKEVVLQYFENTHQISQLISERSRATGQCSS